MNHYWRYLIPSILTIVFILISSYFHFSIIFAVLLIANVLNWKWGEFESKELADTLRFFYTTKQAKVIKNINAFILLGFIFWSLTFVDKASFGLVEFIGFSISVGVFTGCFIITLGHDLLHSKSKFQQGLSALLFTVSGIPHFATEHICGHHREVGLKEDPTTAMENESFYTYFFKITRSNLMNIWLHQFGFPKYLRKKIILTNIGMVLLLWAVWICIYLFTNNPMKVLSFFIIQGFISYILYELINYIQHYGLLRTNRDQPITQDLAWNCYYKYTNYILCLLPLHSLHHLTNKDCEIHQFKDGPRMPYLYFLMILMAMIPPLWFNKMNGLLKQYNPITS